MGSSLNDFLIRLTDKLKTYDKAGAAEVCNELVDYIYQSEEVFEVKDTGKIVQQLRNNRMFEAMQKVGDVLIQSGRGTYRIRKFYAQALIDQNNLTAAKAVLNELVAETENAPADNVDAIRENIEAKGLIGRIYKQLYINANKQKQGQRMSFVKQAITEYLNVYKNSPEQNSWHGINGVALLMRAKADNIDVAEFPDPVSIASAILDSIEQKNNEQVANAWDFATAAEACIALNRPKDGLEWISGYARMPYADAFEIGSTLRQFEEVWRLEMDSETGRLMLPILRAELLRREGGNVLIDIGDLQEQKATELATSAQYESLTKASKIEKPLTLEKVFGNDSFQTYKWYMNGAARCLAVARIGRDAAKGFGTGFLLKGSDMNEKLGDELILLTNAHVVSDDTKEKSIRSDEAVIIFELLNSNEEFRVGEIIWTSPSNELDTTLIRFASADQVRLKELTKNVKLYRLASRLPQAEADGKFAQRVYIIGHPAGGTLQLSFQDNLVLDIEDPRIHYRTPTVGGSSGSPIFNDQWDLIGIHHAGSTELRCLNGKPGTYEANEGMWIDAVKKGFAKAHP